MKPVVAVPATLLLIYRAWSRKSLTPTGILFATITAILHALHPSAVPFALLCVFFLGGTTTTKVRFNGLYRTTGERALLTIILSFIDQT